MPLETQHNRRRARLSPEPRRARLSGTEKSKDISRTFPHSGEKKAISRTYLYTGKKETVITRISRIREQTDLTQTLIFGASGKDEPARPRMLYGHRSLVKCSIPGYSSEVFFLKKHIEDEHAPAIFNYYQVESERLVRTRVQCLIEMVQEVMEESRLLHDMVDLINKRGAIQPG